MFILLLLSLLLLLLFSLRFMFFFSNNFVTMTLVGRRILIEMVADENENSKRPANGPLRN